MVRLGRCDFVGRVYPGGRIGGFGTRWGAGMGVLGALRRRWCVVLGQRKFFDRPGGLVRFVIEQESGGWVGGSWENWPRTRGFVQGLGRQVLLTCPFFALGLSWSGAVGVGVLALE